MTWKRPSAVSNSDWPAPSGPRWAISLVMRERVSPLWRLAAPGPNRRCRTSELSPSCDWRDATPGRVLETRAKGAFRQGPRSSDTLAAP